MYVINKFQSRNIFNINFQETFQIISWLHILLQDNWNIIHMQCDLHRVLPCENNPLLFDALNLEPYLLTSYLKI